MPAKSLQWWPTLCDLMDCTLPGSSVHGILQARLPEWVSVPFPSGISLLNTCLLRLLHCGGFFTTEPPGKPGPIPCHLCLLYPQAPCGVTPAAPGYFPRGHKTLGKRCSLRVPFLINQQKRDHWVLPEAPAKVSSGHTSCDWVISQSLNSAQ